MLELELPWDRQPNGHVSLNTNDSLTDGLVALQLGDQLFDIVDKAPWVNSGAELVVTSVGKAVRLTRDSAQSFHKSLAIAPPFTVGVLARQSVIGVNRALATVGDANSNRHLLYLTSGNGLNVFSGGSAFGEWGSATAVTDTTAFHAFIGVWAGASKRYGYIDGVTDNTPNLDAGPSGAVGPYAIGTYYGFPVDSYDFSGDFAISAIWSRELTKSEAARWSARPWSIFAPRLLPIPLGASVGGSQSGTSLEAFAFSETINAYLLQLSSIEEVVSLSDAFASTKASSGEGTESLSLAETTAGGGQQVGSIAESASLSTESSGVLNIPSVAAEAITLSATGTSVAAFSTSVQETLTMSHAETVAATILAAISTTLSLLDEPASNSQNGIVLEDLSINDNTTPSVGYAAASAESLVLADVANVTQAMNSAIAEALSLLESLAGTTSGAFNDGVNEGLSFVVNSTEVVAQIAAIIESASLVDGISATVQPVITASISEALALAEACGGTVLTLDFGGGEVIHMVVDISVITLPAADNQISLPAR